ncbi:MAG: UPF0716 protein FxsA [Paracoccaceae bacterium]|jgi:UPF0716 protein FxsA
MFLFLIFVAIPVIEIALFITIGGWLTLWPTVLTVLSTGFLGSFLVKSQGLQVISEVTKPQKGASSVVDALANGGLIIVAGLLLITPGFFTDAVGFLFLVPPLRQWVIVLASRYVHFRFSGKWAMQEDIVDAEYRDVTPEDLDRKIGPNH